MNCKVVEHHSPLRCSASPPSQKSWVNSSLGRNRRGPSPDAQSLLPGATGDQGLPPICTGCYRFAGGFIYHVHPPGGPGDFHQESPQDGRLGPSGLRMDLPETEVSCSLFHSDCLLVGTPWLEWWSRASCFCKEDWGA